jgi:hypothetical protein
VASRVNPRGPRADSSVQAPPQCPSIIGIEELPPYPGAPRWVRVFGVIALVLVLLLALMMIVRTDGHGPGRHAPAPEREGAVEGAGQSPGR